MICAHIEHCDDCGRTSCSKCLTKCTACKSDICKECWGWHEADCKEKQGAD